MRRHVNGVCFRAGLALSLAALAAGCGADRASQPGIVLVVIDTLRADHLGCYGYGRSTSPNLDRLAAEAVRFERAYAQAPWTLPAVASILTGEPPHRHGAGRDRQGRLHPLRPSVPTVAERLRDAGFATGAVVNVVFCGPQSGLARGFERYDFHSSDASNVGHRDARATTDAAVAWLEEQRDRPFFLLVHYFDPHLTYDPPAPHDSMFEPDDGPRLNPGFGSAEQIFALRRGELVLDPRQRTSLIARYDGEIRFVDEQFARLRSFLEASGRWDDSLVVVVSDHGEEFWDHGGFEHGHTHYRELLHVPLIVKQPGRTAGVVDRTVRQIDIAPTILRYAGVAAGEASPGAPLDGVRDLASVAQGSLWSGELRSIRSVEGTLILDLERGTRQYFAASDVQETLGLADAPRQLERALLALPDLHEGSQETWELTDEERERLRSLGYVQ